MSEVISPTSKTATPPSLRDQIAALEIGESFCLSKRMEQDHATSAQIAAASEALHNRARAAMARAKDVTGHTYIGEVGEFRTTRGHNPVVCFLITRTE